MNDARATTVNIERFNEEGYIVVEDVLDPDADLAPLAAEYAARLDQLATRWYGEGAISSPYSHLPFAERFGRVLVEMGPKGFTHFDISLSLGGVTRDAEFPMQVGAAVFGMLTNTRLLDVVEQVIGPEILSNPIQHVRIKPPERMLPPAFHDSLMTQTDWHQDQGVALPEVDETDMLTVWLAITDATEENGCLCLVPGSHRRGLVTHCPGNTEKRGSMHIPDQLRGNNVTPVPVKQGGALLMDRRTMHASLPNRSKDIRWSFDLRYQPIGQPTGRPFFPAFIVRSRANPASELRDWRVWADQWRATYSHLLEHPAGKTNRWNGTEPVCA